ncbi:hypothetical protein FACS1894184_11650 [Clostridia bacterium]|nr:hypothetical protein FACS1894184_11650 [Clostridia bacterium]
MPAKASDVAAIAVGLIKDGRTIPYRLGGRAPSGMDCRGMVEYCVIHAGGRAGWSDSNDLARRYIDGELIPIANCKGNLKGLVGLLIEQVNENTPARYKADAFARRYGDCTHVGVITQTGDVWSVDASASAGKVRPRTEREGRNCWTHAAKLKGVNYDGEQLVETVGVVEVGKRSIDDAGNSVFGGNSCLAGIVTDGENTSSTPPKWSYAKVTTPDGGKLNLRRAPTTLVDNRVGAAPNGDTLAVIDRLPSGWAKVRYKGIEAYAQSVYLTSTPGEPG